MKRKREFSPRERRMIDGFIRDICRHLQLPGDDPDLNQCGWEAFLSVYRDAPELFSHHTFLGWRRAYFIIWDGLSRERDYLYFSRYKVDSLDQPVSREVPVSRVELLQSPHGDFQNSVCFHDYLGRLELDVRKMAYGLIGGDTMEEIGACYRWGRAHTYRTYRALRESMTEYCSI